MSTFQPGALLNGDDTLALPSASLARAMDFAQIFSRVEWDEMINTFQGLLEIRPSGFEPTFTGVSFQVPNRHEFVFSDQSSPSQNPQKRIIER